MLTFASPYVDMTATLPPVTPPPDLNQKRLESLRKSPVARMLTGATLVLKAYQLDMDWPPPVRTYLQQRLSRALQDTAGKPLSPDDLHVHFSTEDNPAVEVDGHEHYSLQLSLTDLALLSFTPRDFLALIRCIEPDRPLDHSSPQLTTTAAVRLIMNARWTDDYAVLWEVFWARHEATYCALAKLSFLAGLARQYRQKKISRDGYHLALDALGLTAFPKTPDCLERPARATRAAISLLSINEQCIPGVFQLRSATTSHCFIHTLGRKPSALEYISDNPEHMTNRLLAAANASPWLAPCLDVVHSESKELATLGSKTIEGDVFAALTAAQKRFSLDRLDTDIHQTGDDAALFEPIARGLRIISTLDLWQSEPPILERVPVALKVAGRVMRTLIKRHHGLAVNPDQVFIRYVRGTSTSPLGNARTPTTHVHVPNEKPISLSQALMTNYRVEHAEGYLDHGARNIVYTDPDGKGQWTDDRLLAIDADAIERLVKGIDFLAQMTQAIDTFWDNQQAFIEQSFKTTFLAQAVISLKRGTLSRVGFDTVVQALDTRIDAVRWVALGLYVQYSLIDGPQEHYCAGLLVLVPAGKSPRVLYQAGQAQAFIEFNSSDELNQHIETAAKAAQWRQVVLSYLPVRHHQRFDYLLKLWAHEQQPTAPTSVFRPWTDVLYNHDVRKAQAHSLCEKALTGSPFAFMRETLKQNCLDDAQDQIITSKQVALDYWTHQLNRLQLLLAPLAFFLTPAAMASLATELGVLSLNISSAQLPGGRYREKNQALVTALSLGLLQAAPSTPRLLRALRKIATPALTTRLSIPLNSVIRSKSFSALLNRLVNARKTRLERFFNTDSLLKTWNIPGHPAFGTLPVNVWKLERNFLLWTSDTAQARTLLVSTHGYDLPWGKTAQIPNGTELRTYVPHGYSLPDPGLHRVIRKRIKTFSILNNVDNTLASTSNLPTPYVMTDKLLAGTSRPGMIRNYRLSKFQSQDGESYQDISYLVRNSNLSPLHGQLASTPVDVLTVRNRLGIAHPTLENLFNALSAQGIHYDKILLVHCRCSAFKGLFGLAPTYQPPVA
ncbi:dermonecrotic toxin domain-containing protein [Pseudomonas sp. NA-150]|uniref:dermonecrotic toxin domain-containing protein n=1 Tax=Pseudomonas sp. NA-150 TaxID=3367525 RepID=UPI0037CBF7B6